jgi:hypothetical protein
LRIKNQLITQLMQSGDGQTRHRFGLPGQNPAVPLILGAHALTHSHQSRGARACFGLDGSAGRSQSCG